MYSQEQHLERISFLDDSRNCEAATLPSIRFEEEGTLEVRALITGSYPAHDSFEEVTERYWESRLSDRFSDAVFNGDYYPVKGDPLYEEFEAFEKDDRGRRRPPALYDDNDEETPEGKAWQAKVDAVFITDVLKVLPNILQEHGYGIELLEVNGTTFRFNRDWRSKFDTASDRRVLPHKWGVCDVCNGNGTHVNPSIDCGGLTAKDFARDPDFAEAYGRGEYDQPCNKCGGRTTVPVPDFGRISDEDRKVYEAQQDAEYADREMELAELRFGC
jgi:hypothetical protein